MTTFTVSLTVVQCLQFFCFEGSITLLVPLQEAVYSQKNRSQFPSVNRNVTSSIILFYIVFALICW
jgi:proton-coupled amino acid transporter